MHTFICLQIVTCCNVTNYHKTCFKKKQCMKIVSSLQYIHTKFQGEQNSMERIELHTYAHAKSQIQSLYLVTKPPNCKSSHILKHNLLQNLQITKCHQVQYYYSPNCKVSHPTTTHTKMRNL